MSAPAGTAAELFEIARAEDGAGRLAEAEARYREVLAQEPAHAGAHHQLGLLAMRAGRSDLALGFLGRAAALDPDGARYHLDLAMALGGLGRFGEAEQRCREALRRDANAPEAAYGLAQLLYRLGRFEEAVSACREALRLRPDYVEAHDHLGTLLAGLGRSGEAERWFREALRLDPRYADAYRNLGDLSGNLHRFEQAVNFYREALLLKSDSPGTWNNLGLALTSLGRLAEADTCYGEALRLKPDFIGARVNRCMARLPLIYRDEAEIERVRRDYARELDAACRLDVPPAAVGATGGKSPFLLAYQGRCDRDLQSRYGVFIAQVMARLYPQWTAPPAVAPPGPGEPVRVGILSAYFYDHSNWKVPIKGWLQGLDKSRFRLFGYHVGDVEDAETAVAKALCHRFVERLPTLERWAETIRSDRLHVLLIPGIGMDNATVRLAALRLAPVQATSWGHPDTSGLPTIDDYLSSDLMEPPGAEAHYTERLVRLPNLSIWYEPPSLAPETLSRADLGVPAEAVLYWCCQSLYKYLPRYDGVFARIARAVPEARFLFIWYPHGERVTAIFRERLAAAFAELGVDAERHCLFLPTLRPAQFAAVSRLADVFLDSLGWSGCNSTLEALAADLPVVTMSGDLMRGRHSTAILAMLGMSELIAQDLDGFVDLAVGLGRDPVRRQALAKRIAMTKHRLWRDQAAIDGLAAYLEAAARRGTGVAGKPQTAS